jgi:hypothetical protein
MSFTSGERAYVLGLLVAGGELTPSKFLIRFPFDQWGVDPKRQNLISTHILTRMRSTFHTAYGLNIDFSLGAKNRWTISPLGDPDIVATALGRIRKDLQQLGLPDTGVLLESADLVKAQVELTEAAAIRFLAAICDVRASLTPSNRNRKDTTPIVSIEVPARTKNFSFVIQLCKWVTSLGSVTDQILFNHPSLQSANDPDYSSWRKGFKIRIRAGSFVDNLSFAISAKSFDAKSLANAQDAGKQEPCCTRKINVGHRSIHTDLGSTDLPESIRGQVFLHFHHLCAALGCPNAPLDEVKRAVDSYRELVSVFPICSKGAVQEMKSKFHQISAKVSDGSGFREEKLTLVSIVNRFADCGYVELKNGLAYLVAEEIKGKRHRGNAPEIVQQNADSVLVLTTIEGERMVDCSPIMISNSGNDRAIVVSSPSGKTNQRLLGTTVSVTGINIRVNSAETYQ